MASTALTPTLAQVTALLLGNGNDSSPKGNLVPVYLSMPADLLTPVAAYLRISHGAPLGKPSFLCESVTNGEKIGRYSFIGADPYKVLRCGPGLQDSGDPLAAVQAELDTYKYIALPGLPKFTGGAMGYLAYEAVRHFEPRTALNPDGTQRTLRDPFDGMPEAVWMLCDRIVIFDHIYQTCRCVAHVHLPEGEGQGSSTADAPALIAKLYAEAAAKVAALAQLLSQEHTPMPAQGIVRRGAEGVSNVGADGYKAFVRSLRADIVRGNIIQAVPSQRLARPTDLHPFNAYRTLRQLNPSPYMFYVDAGDAQLVGASPETLCKIENNKVAVHAIAGTVKRGRDDAEDDALGAQLLASAKDRAEHVMLVDLARNDISRVCEPRTTHVESLMRVERFSHVIHLTSRVTGMLRAGKTRFDALRSIFPAGTVSGAPKVKAIELVSALEGERRGVYAGAVGHLDYAPDEMDVCIAIRTMTFRAGVAYLQAGGGIVYDSLEDDEFVETINKLGSNVRCLQMAEEYYINQQAAQSESEGATEAATPGAEADVVQSDAR